MQVSHDNQSAAASTREVGLHWDCGGLPAAILPALPRGGTQATQQLLRRQIHGPESRKEVGVEGGGEDRTHLLGPDPWHLEARKELDLGPDQLACICLPPWDFGQVSTPASVTVSPSQNEDVPTCQEVGTG